MDFQQIRDFVNPAVAQATGLQEVENLSMPVPVAYVPAQLVIDGALSLTSENPVQNKVIAVAIQQLDGRITAIEGQFSEGVTEAVNNWLAAHPEATTTVQDGAITYAKLDANLKGEVDQISELKSALNIKTISFEQGALDASNGNTASSTTRIRTTDYIDGEITSISVGSGYYVNQYAWKKSDGSFVGVWNHASLSFVKSIVIASSVDTTEIPSYSDYNCKLVIRRTNNGAISPDDVSASGFTIVPASDVETLKIDVVRIDTKIASLEDSMQNVFATQFIPDNYTPGYYFVMNGAMTIQTSSSYRYVLIKDMKPGKYYFKNLAVDFTYFRNKSTGVFERLSTLTGLTGTVTEENAITISYDFDLYVTCGTTYLGLFSDFHTPDRYVYGYYDKDKTVYVGSGSADDYATLKAGIEKALETKGGRVIVGRGTYDLIAEFGSDYFNSFVESTSESMGIQLGNDICIVFASDSKVTAHYNGSNAYVPKKFSPFNKIYNGGGFTIENMTLEASNCRYAIHDEDASKSDVYHNTIKNCKITFDNSGNTQWGARQCIGGGLGQTGEIDIVGCIFDSVLPSGATNYGVVSYHNSNNENARSNINIRDCYFGKGQTVRASYYGAGTKMTRVLVSGCSLGGEPQLSAETAGSAVNVEILSFNNDIRNDSYPS